MDDDKEKKLPDNEEVNEDNVDTNIDESNDTDENDSEADTEVTKENTEEILEKNSEEGTEEVTEGEFTIAKKGIKEKLKEFDEDEDHFISKRNLPTITFGAIILFGIIIYVLLFKNGYFTSEKLGIGYPNMPIAYSKGNELYIDDLKNTPYKVTDNLGVDNMYSYMFVGVGTDFSENGKNIFYKDNIKEDGTFDLYYRETSSKSGEGKGKLIAKNTAYFESSEDGKKVVYVKDATQTGGKLYSNDLKDEYAIDEGIVGVPQMMKINGKGKYISYLKYEEDKADFYVSAIDGTGKKLIGKDVLQFEIPKKSDKLYYIKYTDETKNGYSLFQTEFGSGKEPLLISDNITGMGILENEKDIIYMTNGGNNVKYSDILEDDLAENDKNILEPNPENYNEEDVQGFVNDYTAYVEKVTRDEVRKELEGGEFPGISSTVYILTEGKSVKVADNIIDSKFLGDNGEFVIYSEMPTEKIEKIKLSEISSLQDVWSKYINSLLSKNTKTYFVKPGQEPYLMEYDNIDIGRTEISKKLNLISFYTDFDETKGQGKLLLAGIKGDTITYYAPLSDTASSTQFSGAKSDFAYLDNVTNGIGTLNFVSSNIPTVVGEGVMSFKFGKENTRLYFIDEVSHETGQGNLRMFESGTYKDVDKDVLAMSIKYNKRIAYIKNYNMETKTGELYYLNGEEKRLIDGAMTSIFDY